MGLDDERHAERLVACKCASNCGYSLQHMRAADLEPDSLVRNALVCASHTLCFCQDFLTHLIKVIEALACKNHKVACAMHCSAMQAIDVKGKRCQGQVPGRCRNSPQSLPPVLDLTSCNTSGLLVQISGPLGRKSLPTYRSNNTLEIVCKLTAAIQQAKVGLEAQNMCMTECSTAHQLSNASPGLQGHSIFHRSGSRSLLLEATLA